jgi:hypothetical protein
MNSRGIHYLATLHPSASSFDDSASAHKQNQPTRRGFFNYLFNRADAVLYVSRLALRLIPRQEERDTMPRKKGVTSLELLRRKHAELADQLKAAEAKQRERERQLDIRRKELLGTVVADYLKEADDTPLAKTLFELVSQKLTKPADRALFPNLPAARSSRGISEKSSSADVGQDVGNG